MQFEWDDDKATRNQALHGVSFEEAIEVFLDPYALEEFDEAHSEFEDRFQRLGISSKRLLLVVFTERNGDSIRIISARKATSREEEVYEYERYQQGE